MASPRTLFKLAALLNAVSVPGHIILGLTNIHPAINAIPSTPQHKVGKRGAQNAWNYVNSGLLIAGISVPLHLG